MQNYVFFCWLWSYSFRELQFFSFRSHVVRLFQHQTWTVSHQVPHNLRFLSVVGKGEKNIFNFFYQFYAHTFTLDQKMVLDSILYPLNKSSTTHFTHHCNITSFQTSSFTTTFFELINYGDKKRSSTTQSIQNILLDVHTLTSTIIHNNIPL